MTDGSGSLQISQFKVDGELVRHVTSGPANHNFPSVSPDGSRVIFTGDDTGRTQLYSRDLLGKRVVQLTHEPMTATSPNWSPDGKSIVYSALPPAADAYQIFVADSDGNRPRQLTHDAASGSTQPTFSPDGSRIAFIRGHQTTVQGPNGSEIELLANRIWVMNADGSDQRALTEGPRDAYPQWLDSHVVLFARQDVARGTTMIRGASLDGLQQRTYSPATVHVIEPRPLPDGRSYAATLIATGGLRLVRIARADGALLTSPAVSDFIVNRIFTPPSAGSSFTLAWIASPPGATAAPWFAVAVVLALAVLATAVIAGVGIVTLRKTSAC